MKEFSVAFSTPNQFLKKAHKVKMKRSNGFYCASANGRSQNHRIGDSHHQEAA
jgi:hypothetical protein